MCNIHQLLRISERQLLWWKWEKFNKKMKGKVNKYYRVVNQYFHSYYVWKKFVRKTTKSLQKDLGHKMTQGKSRDVLMKSWSLNPKIGPQYLLLKVGILNILKVATGAHFQDLKFMISLKHPRLSLVSFYAPGPLGVLFYGFSA